MSNTEKIKAKIGRPAATSQRIYFTGGGLPKSIPLLSNGWQLATDKHPGKDYVLAGISAFRLLKDGTSVKLYRFALRQSTLDKYAARIERIRLDRIAMDNKAIAEMDRKLLAAKNAATRTPPKARGRKKRRKAA